MNLRYDPRVFLPANVDAERRPEGSIVLRSPVPIGPYRRCLGEYLEYWADRKPDAVFLAQREGDAWRNLTYADARTRTRAIASSLIRRDLTADRPVAILSDNSIEHALMTLGAMHAGIPAAPISPAYSLMSKDFAKLRAIFALIKPGLVFTDDGARYSAAIEALRECPFESVAVRNADGGRRTCTSFDSLLEAEDTASLDRVFAAVHADTIGKLLLTSGSTGHPKAVINTQRMMCSNQTAIAQAWPFMKEEPPVLVDWLPWNHTFGGNFTLGAVLCNGGTLYIDEGKPVPGLIETTVRNLREVSPTLYFNVPRGFDLLIPHLEADEALRLRFFSKVRTVMYAAAALPLNLWTRLNRLAVETAGDRVKLISGWGATETAPGVSIVHFDSIRPSVIGLPIPGTELKMIPLTEEGKFELRVRGPNVTPGYLQRPDLTAAAFDEEGFYKIGDAGRFADPADYRCGIEFAGRLAEDFKLSTGTWVHVGALRVQAIEALAPVAQDVVIAGHDRDYVSLLIFPSLAFRDRIDDAEVRQQVRDGLQRLRDQNRGSCQVVARASLLTEPPSIDAGEITDKGYINQRAVLERRAAVVESLYGPAHPSVISLDDSR